MARTLEICIRGGGIVGHTLALLLARERLRVGLVAPGAGHSGARSDVRAYALNQKSRELLQGLRCWPDAPHITAVSDMHVKEAGAGMVNFSAARFDVPALAWIADVPALESQLAEAVRFQPQIEVLDTAQTATLTVVCEGHSSVSRRQFGADLDVTAYPQWAIAARVRCETPHLQAARQWFTPGDIVGFLPLDGEHGNSMAIVWSVDEAHKTELLEASPEAFSDKLQLASENQFGRLALISERAAWPLQLALAPHWCGVTDGQAWVLAGDAAHTVHPLAGQGLNLGLADVGELANLIRGRDYWRPVNDEKMLRRYERARKADVALMGAATDGLQQLFSRAGPQWRSVRNWGMNGFERSGLLKRWVARQAMGMDPAPRAVKTETEGT
jgi:2-polyprenyl-6-methoxyphenol hydroxylase-like FAD-dependent oxidoreductase